VYRSASGKLFVNLNGRKVDLPNQQLPPSHDNSERKSAKRRSLVLECLAKKAMGWKTPFEDENDLHRTDVDYERSHANITEEKRRIYIRSRGNLSKGEA
jgi:hypothetical protein